MLCTKSPSARAAQTAERELRLQRHQQRQQKQRQQQQQANKPATPPALRDELGANHQPTKHNGSSINISGNSNNVIVASAVAPASTKGTRLSFGPLPQERYSIESGFPSISFSSPSPPPPDDSRRSCSLAPPSHNSRQGEAASSVDDSSSSKGSESSSCVVIDVDGMDTETNDDHAADTEKDLLSRSTTSSIKLACELDGASLALPPQGEVFGSDSPDQKQQQQQQQQQKHDDLTPIPFIRGSNSSNPDAAVFDFDVDEIDGLIGEMVEEPEYQEEHSQSLAGEMYGQRKQQQLQEEQPPQQLQQQDYQQQQHDTQTDEGEGGQEEQGGEHQQQQQQQPPQQQPLPPPPPPQQQQDKHSDEEDGGETSATAAPAVATTFMGPAQAVLADPIIQQAIGNAMAIASRMDYITKEANTHASTLAAQSQVEVGLAWQGVVSAMHTVAVSLKVNNEKLAASNADLKAEKRRFIRKINSLENHVKGLIAQRDRLTTRLHESGAGSPAETSGNGSENEKANGNDNECVIYDCTSPVGGMGVCPATPVSATAAAAAVPSFDTPAAKPALVSGTDTVIGQPDYTMTTAAVPAVTNAITKTTETTTTTMAPQQCEVGLPAQTVSTSGTPSAVAAPSTTTSTPSPSIPASIAKPAPPSTTSEKTRTTECHTLVASTATAPTATPTAATKPAAAPTTAATAAAPIAAPTSAATAADAFIAPTVTAAAAAPTAAAAAATVAAPTAAPTAAASAPTASTTAATAATPVSVHPKVVVGTPKHRSGKKTPGSTTGGRTPWVGGGVGGGVFGSPPAVENRVEVMSTPASLAARLENEMRQEDAKRTPLRSAPINTVLRSVPSTARKVRKASPCASIPTLGQAYATMVNQNTKVATKATATVAVKRIISDNRGATDGNQRKPEGMYGRLRSASRPRKTDTTVVASGGKKVVAGAGVSSRSRQETVTNKGGAGGRSKVAPKKRWR